MHKQIKRLLACFIMFLLSNIVFAQQTTETEVMKSNGKIYVVMIVVIVIVLGLFGYVFSLDRKISRLEKNND
ncbi:MAG: CcmD family protein [Sphingobacteriia bacterium]|nr:CcmD family protein [Sphingobacteriia bacterium]